ncbi:hypothetical protein JZO76_01170 [Enterococcus sp. MJM12]|uniref:Uncharacterized protein n=1 Tax=Candidatus Enterococcus myersii TaxID=2815322 RepID=A0ABS3H3W2_9ENTE|nr:MULTISPECIES: hypothetical protein [Enterococcus]MBO0448137.1 hypothetical protein [Enterococcus sp. MJM12]MCD1024689.1 hypothetical protein [Enterococcus sp. SMC-9]MDT2740291.1 hypothetical protein [Enterococcus canintestini]
MKKRFTGQYATYLKIVACGGPKCFAEAMAFHHLKEKYQHLTIDPADIVAIKEQMAEEKEEGKRELEQMKARLLQPEKSANNFLSSNNRTPIPPEHLPDNVVPFRPRK